MAKKKLKQNSNNDEDGLWTDDAGWTAVDLPDDALLGAEEDGFMGLEVLDPATLSKDQITTLESFNKPEVPLSAKQVQNNQKRAAEKKQKAKEKKQRAKQKKRAMNEFETTANAAIALPHPSKQKKPGGDIDVSAWEPLNLHPAIMAVLKASLRFPAPTQIQAEAIPAAIRDKRDIIGAAQTGSGKTLAFGIPIIHYLLAERGSTNTSMNKEGEGKLRALILVPTRELALQVSEHMNAIAKPCGIWIAPIVGGISALKQERLLSKKPHIVVATPGRLWDMMRDAYVANHLTDFTLLSFLVLDEADRMVQQGHYSELSSILGLVKVALDQRKEEEEDGADESGEEEEKEEEEGDDDKKKKRKKAVVKLQTFVFSATLTLPTNLRKRLRKGGGGASGSAGLENLMDAVPFTSFQSSTTNNNNTTNKPKIIDQTSERRLADKVTETIMSCPEAEQDDYLYCFLASHPGRTIVFVNAISSVRRLAALLKLLSLPASPLHAGMQQRQRLTHLDNFKEDPNAILIATDVAARGLDVKDVRCVVHYQLPASVDTYVHRCGRTARADADGLTVAMVTPKENARHRALLRALGRGDNPPPEFPIDNTVMGAAKKRVRLAVRIDDVMRRKKKESAETSWRKRNAEEMGIMLSDEDDNSDDDGGEDDDDVVAVGKRRKTGKGNIRSIHDRKAVSEKQQEKEVGKLQLELAELLAEPLQPKISSKYFAGGAAAAVAVGLEEKDKKKKNGKGGGSGQKDGMEGGGGAATVVKVAVAMANRKMAKDNSSSKDKNDTGGGGGSGSVQVKGKKKKHGVQMSRKVALQAAIQKKLQGKQKNTKKGGLVVVPPAFGREMNGPDALQTLRNKLALVDGN